MMFIKRQYNKAIKDINDPSDFNIICTENFNQLKLLFSRIRFTLYFVPSRDVVIVPTLFWIKPISRLLPLTGLPPYCKLPYGP